MKEYSRIFRVDDDDQLHRFPLAQFNQIRQRTKSIQLFAGQLIRFIHAVIEKDEDHPPRLRFPEFIQCRFDESGYLDQKDLHKQLLGSAKMLEVREGSDWDELFKMEYLEPHRWKPKESVVAQLKIAIMNEGSR